MKWGLFLFLFAGPSLLVQAEDWTTVDGQVYKNVTVVSHDDGYVTVLDSDGGARIMLSELPPALRARFGFDPAKACACVAQTEEADKRDKEAIAAEERAQDQALAANQPPQPPVGAPSVPPAAQPAPAASVSAPPSAPPEVDQIAEAKKQDIREQIKSLQDDIALMEGDLGKTKDWTGAGGSYNGRATSHGAYSDRLSDEERQLAELQTQLAQ